MSTPLTAINLAVAIPGQWMVVFDDGGNPLRRFTISTSKNPPSCRNNSFGTPWGLHEIADKIGDGAPMGMVFKGRIPIGLTYPEVSPEDRKRNLITTRILRLNGLEPGLNQGGDCDSYDRYIYIHGTNHENRLGRPFSGGCIEMANRDVLELFGMVDEGARVGIFQ